jgi:hypothetical protein
MNTTLEEIALELISFLTELGEISNLRDRLNGRGVLTQDSVVERDRTMEVEVLEFENDHISVAAFSDGLTGTVGTGAIFYPEGMELDSLPQLFVRGVPTDEINIKISSPFYNERIKKLLENLTRNS